MAVHGPGRSTSHKELVVGEVEVAAWIQLQKSVAVEWNSHPEFYGRAVGFAAFYHANAV